VADQEPDDRDDDHAHPHAPPDGGSPRADVRTTTGRLEGVDLANHGHDQRRAGHGQHQEETEEGGVGAVGALVEQSGQRDGQDDAERVRHHACDRERPGTLQER
jgi:hypothetical protein